MALRRGGTAFWAWTAAGVCLVVVAVVAVLTGREPAPPSAGAGSRPVVTFVGDSWTAATGSESGRGYAAPAAERAGWTSHVLGISGTGYLQGAPDRTFGARIGRAAGTEADVVVVQGSLNDDRSDPPQLEPAVRDTLADLQDAVGPGTVVLVIGASHTPGTERAAIERINDAIGSAAETVGVRFVDPAEENWNDPADPAIWADPIHPNDAGYRLIADHVSELLRESVRG
ncbi:MAG TPA: SGNH/GDSL hydrolase family protein [Blastococcus sp.]|nr:SGNH/GDSL hydrolase family protein [Blastococcus sp.]